MNFYFRTLTFANRVPKSDLLTTNMTKNVSFSYFSLAIRIYNVTLRRVRGSGHHYYNVCRRLKGNAVKTGNSTRCCKFLITANKKATVAFGGKVLDCWNESEDLPRCSTSRDFCGITEVTIQRHNIFSLLRLDATSSPDGLLHNSGKQQLNL